MIDCDGPTAYPGRVPDPSFLDWRKHRWRFWRSAREIILFVDGQPDALRFDKVTDKISASWTQKDVKELVKKEMAKALMEHKPMTWTQFIIILIPVLATLGLVFLIAKRIGAF